jgi:hypothetical protein
MKWLYIFLILTTNVYPTNCIGSVIISLLSSSTVDRELLWSYQIKDYKIGICCFSEKDAALRSKSKDWLTLNSNHSLTVY